MYTNYFGLTRCPFSMSSDPDFLFLTEQHQEALAGLTYGIAKHKGLLVMTGGAGTGKTTVLTRLISRCPPEHLKVCLIVNPVLTPTELLETVLLASGLREIPCRKARQLDAFNDFLLRNREQRKTTALIIDEAHKLSFETLEEIRLLGNLEIASDKLLQIVLVGETELDEVLGREPFRQLQQRIAFRLSVGPLPPAGVEQYMRHRWAVAGGGALPFSPEAIAAVAQIAAGIPRVINVICDNALTQAFGEGAPVVHFSHVHAVCRDLRLDQPSPPAQPRSEPIAAPVSLPLYKNGHEPLLLRLTGKWRSTARSGPA